MILSIESIHSLRADYIAKCILSWVGLSSFTLLIIVQHGHRDNPFFRLGPNETLHLFGLAIDTWSKYMLVIFYTMISTIVRTFQQEVLNPWIIQNIQNDAAKTEYTTTHAYEIVIIDIVYRWFDWFMYMNILLAQVDMMVVEILGNVATALYTTSMYMKNQQTSSL
jgi:hypothetical protein